MSVDQPNDASRFHVSRRHLLGGAAASGLAWVAPSVMTLDRVEAAVGSACTTTSNLALLGTATQVSTTHGGVASRAIDGNRNGSYWGGSVIHTANSTSVWWEVDLGSVRQIDEVWLWNRTDCCSVRTQNVQIHVDGVTAGSMAGTVGRPSVISLGCEGQVVRVINGYPGSISMQLAEVEVYGC